MIVASAIKLTNGSVFVGKRHGDCYKNMKTILKMKEPDQTSVKAIQGFINDKLQFLNREEAYYEAYSCNQCQKKEESKTSRLFKWLNLVWKPQLASEDLW